VNKVYLINSTYGTVTDAQCDTMIEALNIQLSTFCNDWSMKPVIIVRSSPPPGSYQLILTTDPAYTIPGAYGYHTNPLADGSIIGYVCVNVILPAGVNTNNGILYPFDTASGSVSKVASHELLEMLVDPGVNKVYTADASSLIPPPPGVSGTVFFYAEVGDAVNQQSYTIITSDSTKVQVSDYVLPSWFISSGIPPYNYNNTLTAPFQLSQGGYYSNSSGNGPLLINYK
jgi:hypothetical protein